MLSDLLELLISTVIGDPFGDGSGKRVENRTRRRLAAFRDGRLVRVRCALREDDVRWRRGVLRLTRGRAAWARRFTMEPSLVLDRRTSTAQQGRRAGGRELVGPHRRLVVLGYQVGDRRVELAVRRRDLFLVGRVLDLPPTRL